MPDSKIPAEFQEALDSAPFEITEHPKLQKAIQYVLGGGGKRIRPMLLLWSHRLFSDNLSEAIPFAVALELIHNYSLVHDDLPCMDDDAERRGKPTVHVAFDEATAVLTGDALLNGAFEMALDAVNHANNQDKALQAYGILLRAAGGRGMLAGQMMDLFDTIESEKDLQTLNAHKTGALFVAACLAGAVLGGASAQEQYLLQRYAENLGIAFQLQDDLLDENKDIYEENMTAFRFLSRAEIEDRIAIHSQAAMDSLNELSQDTSVLYELVFRLINRKV